MAELEWQKLSPHQYEELVAVLLSHINPEIRRIDGSGGDGGRDCEFARDGGTEIYELKSFTGRMTAGRRRQVERSLEKAARRNPVAWHLVVPIDPTPAEQDWFDKIGKAYEFPLSWHGKVWLNGEVAKRPFIPRYFLGDENERVIKLLTQLREEQAAVTNVRDGMKRLGALADRINEIDPHYRVDVDIRDGNVTAKIIPRYAGAEHDRPFLIKLGLRFPNTEEGRATAKAFQSAMDFGSPVELESEYIHSVTLDGPATFGDAFPEGGSLKIGPPQPTEDWEMKLVLRAITSDEVPLASLPITLAERTSGQRGVIVRGSDPPGSFKLEMQLNVETRYVNLHFTFSATTDHYPHDLLPALTFMQAAQPPNRVQLLVGDDQVPLGDSVEVPDLVPIEDEYIRLITDLARVQRETGTFFAVPAEFSPRDLRELSEAVDLLDGREVTQEWGEGTFDVDVADPDRFLQAIASAADGGSFIMEADAGAAIAGHVLPLGKLRTYLPSARIKNIADLEQALEGRAPGEDLRVTVSLEATGDKIARMSLIPG